MVVGALCVLVGALAFSWLLRSAGDRVDVLALARDVPVGQKLVAEDLVVAAVAADPALSPIPAADKQSLVGRRAGTDLKQGTLLASSQLATGDLLRDGEELVAVAVERGRAPVDALGQGDTVKAVSTPASDGAAAKAEAPPEAVTARVVKVGRANASGAVVVQVAVPSSDGALLAARSATGRIALVLVSKGRG
ncbi:SAF domain-containing protein [Streptomyces anulatus]|uniref:SAF domain-containing protein n=1 Tax=Streptomyces anulatus TaxID=1892 RepID=UPI00365771C4